MKYGKEFQHIINESSFPDDWKSSAIEYGQLKKLIKSVVAELSGMGLSPDVLHRLLVTEDDGSPSPESRDRTRPVTPSAVVGEDDGEVLEFEFESDEASPPMDGSSPRTRGTRVKEVMLDPILDDEDDRHRGSSNGLLATSPEAGPSSLSQRSSFHSHHHHRKFRIRLLSNGQPAPADLAESPKPMSVMDMMSAQGEAESWRNTQAIGAGRRPSRLKRARLDSQGGAKAEYVLTGDPDRPVPQLRLHLQRSAEMPDPVSDPAPLDDADSSDEDDDEPFFPLLAESLSPRLGVPTIDVVPPSPSLSRMRAARSPIWSLTSGAALESGLGDLSLDDPATEEDVEEISTPQPISNPPAHATTPDREFIIPLASDIAFFNLLTAALTSLSAFHAAQQLAFKAAVEKLCLMISQSIQPSSGSLQVVATPLTPSPKPVEPESDLVTARIQRTARASKKDLYAWREIFTLWIESEIFESSAERTRGERTVDQAEARLKRFADLVVKRGLGDRRTLKGKRVREAWEEFLRLNVLLLDLKRFQIANINAARKILKKHDKRTALTASAGFPDFVRSTLSAHVDKDGNISTWTFYNTSLPHVLLASLTDTLLPILPSLDDYACLICTSIAFKPIRLNCGHLFCVRCLVKMQRAGKAECPLCRSKVVLLADKNSLDMAVMNFMKEWFPKEVKEKQRENEDEIAHEQMAVTGHDPRCTIIGYRSKAEVAQRRRACVITYLILIED